jgi:hypothetical protein
MRDRKSRADAYLASKAARITLPERYPIDIICWPRVSPLGPKRIAINAAVKIVNKNARIIGHRTLGLTVILS